MMTMRTAAENAALSVFIDAATRDDGRDYPNGAAFIAWQQSAKTDRVLWRYLHEGRPAVIVGPGELEMLIEPVPLSRLARLRNELFQRITVQVSYRRKETPASLDMPPVRADIGRHALERLTPAMA